MPCIDENGDLINLDSFQPIINETGNLPVKTYGCRALLSDNKLYHIFSDKLYLYRLDDDTEYVIEDFNGYFAIVKKKLYWYDEFNLKLKYIEPMIKNYISYWYTYYVTDNNILFRAKYAQKCLQIYVDKIICVVYGYNLNTIFCISHEKLTIVLDPIDEDTKPIIIVCDIVEKSIVKFYDTYMLDVDGAIYSLENYTFTKLNNKFFCSDINYTSERGILFQDDQCNIYVKDYDIIKTNARFKITKSTCKSARKIY